MKKLILASAVLAFSGAAQIVQAAPGAAFRGFCTADEQVVFACKLPKHKQVSLCASSDLGAHSGYLQYRFGEAGKALELNFPAARVHPRGKFVQGQHLWASNGMHWYGFKNGAYHYAVGSAGGRDFDMAAVWVVKDNKLVTRLKCQGGADTAWNTASKLEAALKQASLEEDDTPLYDMID